MEQAKASKGHCNAIFITGLNNIVVTNRTAWLCNVGNPGAVCPLNVIAKWEKCVRSEGNSILLCKPRLLLVFGKRLRFL